MAIELHSIDVRSDTRIRLVFSNHLAIGAFSTSLYTVTAVDALGVDPGVKAILAINGTDTNAELVLQNVLSPGARYLVTAIGVPAQDLSVTTSASQDQFVYGTAPAALRSEALVDDGEVVLYGSDVIWNGTDFQETANGDLARVQGVTNAVQGVTRRLFSDGLPYDPTFGAKSREYVDAPAPTMGDLRTALIAQSMKDDRIAAVAVDIVPDSEEPDRVTFGISLELIGGHKPEPVSASFNA